MEIKNMEITQNEDGQTYRYQCEYIDDGKHCKVDARRIKITEWSILPLAYGNMFLPVNYQILANYGENKLWDFTIFAD